MKSAYLKVGLPQQKIYTIKIASLIMKGWKYTLPSITKDYLKLMPEVLTLPLKPKERGVLIFLQLIALIDMNDIVETKIEDIANRLKITRQTASKYLKQFVDSGYLHKSRNGIYRCQYLAKDMPVKPESEPPIITL